MSTQRLVGSWWKDWCRRASQCWRILFSDFRSREACSRFFCGPFLVWQGLSIDWRALPICWMWRRCSMLEADAKCRARSPPTAEQQNKLECWWRADGGVACLLYQTEGQRAEKCNGQPQASPGLASIKIFQKHMEMYIFALQKDYSLRKMALHMSYTRWFEVQKEWRARTRRGWVWSCVAQCGREWWIINQIFIGMYRLFWKRKAWEEYCSWIIRRDAVLPEPI